MQFDWYAATLPENDPGAVIDRLASLHPSGELRDGRVRQGYTSCTTVVDDAGDRWCDVLHGGPNGVHVVGTGHAAPGVAQAIRDTWPAHLVSRADVASDMMGEGVFQLLLPVAQRVIKSHGMSGNQRLDDDPEKGTTYYMGSRTSQTFGRLYEKGKEQYAKTKDRKFLDEYFHWVRFELEVKPQKQNRLLCSQYSPEQLLGMSRWARDVSREILGHEAARSGVSLYRVSDDAVATRHMMRMYGNLLGRLKDKAGSWSELGIHLGELSGAFRK